MERRIKLLLICLYLDFYANFMEFKIKFMNFPGSDKSSDLSARDGRVGGSANDYRSKHD